MADQLTLPIFLRDVGMQRAAEAQERTSPGWGERALREVERLSRQQETLFTDDLKPFLKTDPAPHFNAIGSIWARAQRCGLIKRTDQTRCSADPKKHAHNYPVYRSLRFGLLP